MSRSVSFGVTDICHLVLQMSRSVSFGVTENNGEGEKKGLSYQLTLALAPGATEKPRENSTVSALHSQIFFSSVGFVQPFDVYRTT